MMNTTMKYFKGSFATVAIGVALAYWIGGGSFAIVLTTLILAVLEVSLSFDNAVVNATVLRDMEPKWRQRFITWGMLIAVFGMRMVFPLLIVSVVAGVNMWEALNIATFTPDKYSEIMTSAHVSVAAFGGAFLAMVFFKYFIDEEKDVHWIAVIEQPLTKLGKIEAVEIGLVLVVMYFVSKYIDPTEQVSFWVSGAMGLVTYIAVNGLGALLSTEETQHDGTVMAAKSGFASFMYLEVLDASFSFDGVIGAFALTNNFFIIAIGLGIGAMFVRSLTIMLVEKGTLEQFKYLESSAFWAIGALATIMFLGSFMHISEIITGLISVSFIAAGVIHSVIENRNEKTDVQVETVV